MEISGEFHAPATKSSPPSPSPSDRPRPPVEFPQLPMVWERLGELTDLALMLETRKGPFIFQGIELNFPCPFSPQFILQTFNL
jgi:hypothetical protein